MALALDTVGSIDAGRPDGDQDLALARLRNGPGRGLQDFRAARLGYFDAGHGFGDGGHGALSLDCLRGLW